MDHSFDDDITVTRPSPFRFRWKTTLLGALLTAAEVVTQLLIWAMCVVGIGAVLYVLTLQRAKAAESAEAVVAMAHPAPCAPQQVLGCIQRLCQTPVQVYALNLPRDAEQALRLALDFWNLKFPGKPVFEWGYVPAKGLIPPGGVVVMLGGSPKDLAPGTLMVTMMQPDRENMCARNNIVSVVQPLNSFSLLGLYHGFRHELGHVLGLPDTYVENCVMTGHGDPLVDHISPWLCEPERALLRAMYPGEGF